MVSLSQNKRVGSVPSGSSPATSSNSPRNGWDTATVSGPVAESTYSVGAVFPSVGTPAKGFEQPLINIEFNRLPPEDPAVFKVYAVGGGVSAYGTPTKFKYIVTNRVRDGEAHDGLFRTGSLAPGNYTIKIIAEDYAGNRASGKTTELPITIAN